MEDLRFGLLALSLEVPGSQKRYVLLLRCSVQMEAQAILSIQLFREFVLVKNVIFFGLSCLLIELLKAFSSFTSLKSCSSVCVITFTTFSFFCEAKLTSISPFLMILKMNRQLGQQTFWKSSFGSIFSSSFLVMQGLRDMGLLELVFISFQGVLDLKTSDFSTTFSCFFLIYIYLLLTRFSNKKEHPSNLKVLIPRSLVLRKYEKWTELIIIISMSEDCEQLICKDDPFANLRSTLRSDRKKRECPLGRHDLGNYSWSVLHTFAAYYPQNPTEEQKQSMVGILKGYRNLYPCKHCRAHFQKDYDKDPPKVENREELSIWVCMQHNNVNKMLGKKQFDCSYQNLMNRWKTGCQNSDQL